MRQVLNLSGGWATTFTSSPAWHRCHCPGQGPSCVGETLMQKGCMLFLTNLSSHTDLSRPAHCSPSQAQFPTADKADITFQIYPESIVSKTIRLRGDKLEVIFPGTDRSIQTWYELYLTYVLHRSYVLWSFRKVHVFVQCSHITLNPSEESMSCLKYKSKSQT